MSNLLIVFLGSGKNRMYINCKTTVNISTVSFFQRTDEPKKYRPQVKMSIKSSVWV